MRRNIEKARLDFADAGRIGRGLGFRQQAGALEIGGKDEIDQALRSARRLLVDAAEDATGAEARSPSDSGASSPKIIRNKVVFPAPLRPTKPTRAWSGRAAVALSNRSRGPSRNVTSLTWSMPACRPPGGFWQEGLFSTP